MSKTQRIEQQAKKAQVKYSLPTMCIRCHLIVEMIRGEKAWSCPRCEFPYPFEKWLIKSAAGEK